MHSASNVRPFRAPSPAWKSRVLAALVYLGVGFLTAAIVKQGLGDSGGMMMFIALAIIFAAFFNRNKVPTSRFFRFHYLQATLLFMFIYMSLKLLLLAGMVILSAVGVVGMTGLSDSISTGLGMFVLGTHWLVMMISVSQALVALIGKSPRIPVVTSNVVYWV